VSASRILTGVALVSSAVTIAVAGCDDGTREIAPLGRHTAALEGDEPPDAPPEHEHERQRHHQTKRGRHHPTANANPLTDARQRVEQSVDEMPHENRNHERLEDLFSNDEETGDERGQECRGRVDDDVRRGAGGNRSQRSASVRPSLVKEAPVGWQQGSTLLADPSRTAAVRFPTEAQRFATSQAEEATG